MLSLNFETKPSGIAWVSPEQGQNNAFQYKKAVKRPRLLKDHLNSYSLKQNNLVTLWPGPLWRLASRSKNIMLWKESGRGFGRFPHPKTLLDFLLVVVLSREKLLWLYCRKTPLICRAWITLSLKGHDNILLHYNCLTLCQEKTLLCDSRAGCKKSG